MGDTVRDGGSPPTSVFAYSRLAVSLGSGTVCWQSHRAWNDSGEDAQVMCRRCLGRAYRNITKKLLHLAPRGAYVILAVKCTQGGDSMPGSWSTPGCSPP